MQSNCHIVTTLSSYYGDRSCISLHQSQATEPLLLTKKGSAILEW